MGFLPSNIFNKNKTQDESPVEAEDQVKNQPEATGKDLTEQTEKIQTQKKVLMRGPGGKFISTKPKKEEPPAVVIQSASADSTSPLTTQTSIFYGQNIRSFFLDNQWYFAILDILPLAQIVYPDQYLNELKNNAEFKKIFPKGMRIIPNQEAENTTLELECISYEEFMRLMPVLRTEGTFFPGPFPEWLQGVSKTPN